MQGDVADITGRLRAVLPPRWFSDISPRLDALLSCIATPWSWLFDLIQYVILQTRLHTASDQWLDLISRDFFGLSLPRRIAETDASFRARIEWAMIEDAATREAVFLSLQHLTASTPDIFEPGNARDTGSYGYRAAGPVASFGGLSYNMSGGWGSLSLPSQFFVSVRRPVLNGISSIAGYNTGAAGYGVGAISYIDLVMFDGSVTDADIQLCIARILPVTSIAWLRIS